MKYFELLEKLNELTPEQLGQDVTVRMDFSEEIYAVTSFLETLEGDAMGNVLDQGHFVLGVDF